MSEMVRIYDMNLKTSGNMWRLSSTVELEDDKNVVRSASDQLGNENQWKKNSIKNSYLKKSYKFL